MNVNPIPIQQTSYQLHDTMSYGRQAHVVHCTVSGADVKYIIVLKLH